MTTEAQVFSGNQKFPLGRLLSTPVVLSAIPFDEIMSSLRRHALGDWGDVEEEDKAENELSLKENFRLLSAYRSSLGVKFWIITEADRSATTVLLPEEY